MKYAKMLGLLALATAALMAIAGSASATVLTTSLNGGTSHHQMLVNESIHAVNNGSPIFHTSLKTITCTSSTLEASITNAGSASTTVDGAISVFSLTECGSDTVTVISKGSLIIHTHQSEPSTFGTLTFTGGTVTMLSHLPFNVTAHCNFVTEETDIGTITSSAHRIATGEAETARIHAHATIPSEGTDFGCGSTATWTATYDVTTPMHLDVD